MIVDFGDVGCRVLEGVYARSILAAMKGEVVEVTHYMGSRRAVRQFRLQGVLKVTTKGGKSYMVKRAVECDGKVE